MKKLICKIFGHRPVISKVTKKVKCKRCKEYGFMQEIEKEHGKIIEYWV